LNEQLSRSATIGEYYTELQRIMGEAVELSQRINVGMSIDKAVDE